MFKTRIDLWLVTPEVTNAVPDISIYAAPLTDHCAIEITLKPKSNYKSRKNYCKFNADLLNDEAYVEEVKGKLRVM